MSRRAVLAAAGLSIPAAAYGAVMRARNLWYDRPGAVTHAPVPVISVGNLAMGGTGKTPLVAWIARRIRTLGLQPAVVSRGYGGNAGPGPVLVSTGEGPRVNARACGDEPHLLARSLPGTIVIVGSDRVEGARAAAGAGAGIVILDDGFQHRRLARDLDILVLDGRAPFADGHLLPWGTLREPASSARRAQLVVLTRLRQDDPASGAMREVKAAGFTGPIISAGHRATGFYDTEGKPQAAPAKALAFCGIGNPGLFRRDLEAAKVVVTRFQAFRDHHPYTIPEWNALTAEARAQNVPLVTTDKDLSRLAASAGASLNAAPLLVLRIEAAVWDEAELVTALRTVVTGAGASRR